MDSVVKTVLDRLLEDIPGSTDADVDSSEFITVPRLGQTIDHGNGITQTFDEYGNEIWNKDGKHHRDNDLPAVIYHNGSKVWYRNGLVHRDNDKPAVLWYDGSAYWYQDGVNTRSGGKPAIIGY